MKLLLDENLSPKLARAVSDLFPDSLHVEECGLGGASDEDIWEFAKAGGFVIQSKNSDFYERTTLYGSPPKAIWLHIGNSTTADIERLIRRFADTVDAFSANPEHTCLILTRAGARPAVNR